MVMKMCLSVAAYLNHTTQIKLSEATDLQPWIDRPQIDRPYVSLDPTRSVFLAYVFMPSFIVYSLY